MTLLTIRPVELGFASINRHEMRYVTYLLACVTLIGGWLLGIWSGLGELGLIVFSLGTMGAVVALAVYYDEAA